MKFSAARLFAILFVVTLMAGMVTPALADSTRIGESAYWDLVKHSRAEVGTLTGLPAQVIQVRLEQLAGEWQPITAVELNDGSLVAVDNTYLLGYLRARQPNLKQITEILDALLAAHAEYPDRVFSTADLNLLREILARPEFQWKEAPPNPFAEWLQKTWDRFLKWLNDLLAKIGIPVPAAPVFPFITSILLAVILYSVFSALFKDLAGEARIKPMDEEDESEPLTSAAAFDRAQMLSRGGDYRAAVRYLYLSSLLLLDERDVLRYDRSKTNREYLRSVANSPELAEPLREVIEVFDDVWYGYHELSEDTFRHYSKRVEELKEKKP